MNKLEMAHQYFMQTMGFIRNNDIDHNFDDVVSEAWDYVDKMQAGADKREKQKAVDDAESSNVFFEKLTDSRSLTKDEHGNCLHFHHEFGHKKCMDCGDSLSEWQPDWSKAPVWGKYWAVDKDLSPFWHEDKPKFDDVEFYQCGKFCDAPLFSYKGPWQDSVRKRP